MKQNLLLLFALCGISYAHAQDNKGLIINEIMVSQSQGLPDQQQKQGQKGMAVA